MTTTELWLILFAIVMTMLALLASVIVATPSNWWALVLWMLCSCAQWGLILYQETKGLPPVQDYTRHGHGND